MRLRTQFPNWLRFQFSVRTLLVVVTLICVALAWKLYYERQRNRTICSQFADNALLSKHWVKDQNDNNFSQFTTQWAKDLSSDSASVTSFLHTDGTLDDHKPCTAFEKQILAKWLAVTAATAPAKPETDEVSSMLNGSFTFYKAIRAKPICIGCHSAIQRSTATGPAIVVGDLIGVVKIEIVN